MRVMRGVVDAHNLYSQRAVGTPPFPSGAADDVPILSAGAVVLQFSLVFNALPPNNLGYNVGGYEVALKYG